LKARCTRSAARGKCEEEARQLDEMVRKIRERRRARGASKLDYLVDPFSA
jgi:hypothetical protein